MLAISVSSAWNSTSGKGTRRSLVTLPPPVANPSLKPCVDSSPAAYFQVIVTAFLWPISAATLPIGNPGCQLLNEVRKMLGAHSLPVASPTPALGISSVACSSRATCTIAPATPEWTVPTRISTFSPTTSLLAFCAPLAGPLSAASLTYRTSRPPSLPPSSLLSSLIPSASLLPHST